MPGAGDLGYLHADRWRAFWGTSERAASVGGGEPERFSRSYPTVCLQLLPARTRHEWGGFRIVKL
jgi:hypothetical protein